MTRAGIKRRLDIIAATAIVDYEAAGLLERELWESVLEAIAAGTTSHSPADLAATALQSRAIPFRRSC